jgi:hypothetical protein
MRRLSLVGCVVVVGALVAAQAAAALAPPGGFSSVSCTSATACTAVGSVVRDGVLVTLAERWDGSSWSIQNTPNPGDNRDQLDAVSCTSAAACTAVGFYINSSNGTSAPIVERWDGSNWSVQAIPTPAVGMLSGVSCPSATVCIAVGAGPGGQGGERLIERWDGKDWSIQHSPIPPDPYSTWLSTVSCYSATACTAIGGSFNGQSRVGEYAERWNGSSWSLRTLSTPYGDGNPITAVVCASPRSCVAVGYAFTDSIQSTAFAERWYGTSWSLQNTPQRDPGGFSYLDGLSCTSDAACVAVGSENTGGGFDSGAPFAARWNGTGWTVQNMANPTGSSSVSLSGVSCTSATACTAVGYYPVGLGTGSYLTLAERWDGTSWSIQNTPNPG